MAERSSGTRQAGSGAGAPTLRSAGSAGRAAGRRPPVRASGLRPPKVRPNEVLPLALLLSVFLHSGLFFAVAWHPALRQKPAFPEPMVVRLVDLPAGRGGALDGTPGQSAKPAPTLPEPPKPKSPPKTTLPGKPQAPKPEGSAPVRSARPGQAVGLGGEGAPGLGGKVPGLILDEPTFQHEWYKARLEDLLKSNWRKPVLNNTQTISASVHFTIAQGGDASNVQIVSSSGNVVFDQSVLRAVYSSAPFPRFPPQYTAPTLGVMYTFELLPEKK
ncbi:MAG: energy transducer TonB [Acidobacteriota bacterium]